MLLTFVLYVLCYSNFVYYHYHNNIHLNPHYQGLLEQYSHATAGPDMGLCFEFEANKISLDIPFDLAEQNEWILTPLKELQVLAYMYMMFHTNQRKKIMASKICNMYRIDTWLEGFNLLKHPWEPRKC